MFNYFLNSIKTKFWILSYFISYFLLTVFDMNYESICFILNFEQTKLTYYQKFSIYFLLIYVFNFWNVSRILRHFFLNFDFSFFLTSNFKFISFMCLWFFIEFFPCFFYFVNSSPSTYAECVQKNETIWDHNIYRKPKYCYLNFYAETQTSWSGVMRQRWWVQNRDLLNIMRSLTRHTNIYSDHSLPVTRHWINFYEKEQGGEQRALDQISVNSDTFYALIEHLKYKADIQNILPATDHFYARRPQIVIDNIPSITNIVPNYAPDYVPNPENYNCCSENCNIF